MKKDILHYCTETTISDRDQEEMIFATVGTDIMRPSSLPRVIHWVVNCGHSIRIQGLRLDSRNLLTICKMLA